MNIEQLTRDERTIVRRYEYDDGTVLAVDFGAADTDAAVDVVDDTVIVVIGDEQYELELSGLEGGAHTFIRNGVLTIELEANA